MTPESAIREAFKVLERLETLAEHFAARGNHPAAAACAQIAASYAFTSHCGVFASPRLERVLRTIGAATMRGVARQARPDTPRHVLHVLTYARPVGGDSRFAWRWIRADARRTHSVALTRQGTRKVPEPMRAAVGSRGGRIHVLSSPATDPLGLARQLADAATDVDLVALHLFSDDIVPALAFADPASSPPVVYVHHADHTFWVGSGGCDIIGQLRATESTFLETRRAIDPDRLVTLPIPLEPPVRAADRREARQRLGFADNDVVLLTIATDFKYETARPSFVDLITRTLNRHPNALLVAIGPDDTGEWARAREATGGRITALGRRSDTGRFYEAADIYVDSFPFTSITSVLEAGTYGVPMIAYCPHSADARQLLCAGAPGLTDTLIRACATERYEAELSALIADAALRERRGATAAQTILGIHSGGGWLEHVETVYARALAERRPRSMPRNDVSVETGTLDQMVRLVMSRVSLGLPVDEHVEPLPYASRAYILARLLPLTRAFSLSGLLPKPLQRVLHRRLSWLGRLLGRTRR